MTVRGFLVVFLLFPSVSLPVACKGSGGTSWIPRWGLGWQGEKDPYSFMSLPWNLSSSSVPAAVDSQHLHGQEDFQSSQGLPHSFYLHIAKKLGETAHTISDKYACTSTIQNHISCRHFGHWHSYLYVDALQHSVRRKVAKFNHFSSVNLSPWIWNCFSSYVLNCVCSTINCRWDFHFANPALRRLVPH